MIRDFVPSVCLFMVMSSRVFAAESAANVPPPQPTAPGPLPRRVSPTDRVMVTRLFKSWNLPFEPHRIIGNIYYVGASGVAAFLITTPEGHFLLNSCFEETVPLIQTNVAQLGFKFSDIKILLGSHAHVDHTGGHALVKKLIGAQIVSSEADARLLADGGKNDFSPYLPELMAYTPVQADRIVRDGETVSLGDVTLTAHLTPGHTKGCTTWTMAVTDEGERHDVVFHGSTSIVEGTRLVNNPLYPQIAEDYAATFKKLKALPGDVFLAPHGAAYGMEGKFGRRGSKPNPFINPREFQADVAQAERGFLRQLRQEQSSAVPTP